MSDRLIDAILYGAFVGVFVGVVMRYVFPLMGPEMRAWRETSLRRFLGVVAMFAVVFACVGFWIESVRLW